MAACTTRRPAAPNRAPSRGPALTPNGVALSPDGRTLYYAETAGARLWAFDIESPGQVRKHPWPSPHGGRMLAASPGGHFQRFDSMAVDAHGNLHVATLVHGGISVISPDGQRCFHLPLDDRMVTNLCFGGRDLRTLYVTLSGSGRLIAIDGWPTAGAAAELQRLMRRAARGVGGPGYWISWFALTSTDWGMDRPRALAVFMLITSSNCVGCATGRSPGFAPAAILPM